MTHYKIYFTLDGTVNFLDETDLTLALKDCENLRARRRSGENISHISMSCEDSNMIGQQGVDTVENGKTPDGVDYSWKKRRQ